MEFIWGGRLIKNAVMEFIWAGHSIKNVTGELTSPSNGCASWSIAIRVTCESGSKESDLLVDLVYSGASDSVIIINGVNYRCTGKATGHQMSSISGIANHFISFNDVDVHMGVM